MSEQILPKSSAPSMPSRPLAAIDEPAATDDPVAVAHEVRVQAELNAQYRELRRQAQGVFEAVKGRIGARNEEYLEQVFTKARSDYASGQFLMQRLGADRQLDLPLVANLTQLRHDLLAGIEHPTAGDHMLADTAILGFRNLLRVQGWLGSLCLQVEQNLFGQSSITGADAREVDAMMEKLEQKLLPMLERCQKCSSARSTGLRPVDRRRAGHRSRSVLPGR